MPRADDAKTILNTVESNNSERLKQLLQTKNAPGSWYTEVNEFKENALLLAVNLGQTDMVRDLIESGHLPMQSFLQQDKHGQNALMSALQRNDAASARMILEATNFPLIALSQRNNKHMSCAKIIDGSRNAEIKSLLTQYPVIKIMGQLREFVRIGLRAFFWSNNQITFVKTLLNDINLTLSDLHKKLTEFKLNNKVEPNSELGKIIADIAKDVTVSEINPIEQTKGA